MAFDLNNFNDAMYRVSKQAFLSAQQLHQRYRNGLVNSLVMVICLLGLFLRIYFYVINRSLWLDEASLALSLVNRSFIDLFKPLSYDQAAPIGFLLSQKIVISVFGNRDYTLRLIPLAAGLGSIPLMYSVSKKYNTGLAPFIALGLFALSSSLIYYSSELKQYSSDVLVSLVMLFIAQKCLEDASKNNALVAFGIAGLLAICFSHPGIFVIAGILITLGLVFAKRRDLHRILYVIGIGSIFSASLFLLYFISLQHLASDNVLLQYWRGTFAPLPPWSDLHWYVRAFARMLMNPMGLPVSAITAGVLTLGIFSFFSKRWPLLLILITPFAMALIASSLGKYPFSGRLLLFLIPPLLLLLAEGLEQIKIILLKINKPAAIFITIALIVYFFYNPVMDAFNHLKQPPMRENIKPVMGYIAQNKLRTDLIYVYYGAGRAFMYYAPFYGIDNNDYVLGISAKENPSKYFEEIDRLKGHQRVWVVFSHNCIRCAQNEHELILEHLNEVGLRKSEFISTGASVDLYDLSKLP